MLGYIEKLLKNAAAKHGLDVHNLKIDINTGNKTTKGFRGDIYEVSVVDVNNRRLEAIVKAGSTDETVVNEYHIKEVFQNELQFYTEIFTTIKQFQEKKSLVDSFNSVAEFYGATFEGSVRLIALENLTTQGYELFDKTLLVDNNHIEFVFNEYGKLHGACLAYRTQHEEDFKRITGKISNCWQMYMEETAFKSLLTANFNEVSSYLVNEPKLAKVFEKFRDAEGVFRNACTYKGKYYTLTHGDCWSNNFLFKYTKNKDGTKCLEDVKIIDWQNTGINSPVHDLSYFLYSNASKADFDKLGHYLEVYYKSLSTTIKGLGSDPEVVYPFEVLKSEWLEYSIFGFMMGLMLNRLKLSETKEIVDISDFKDDEKGEKLTTQLCNTKFDTTTYKKRVIDLILHMSEIGAI